MSIIENGGLIRTIRGKVTPNVLYPLNGRQIGRVFVTPANPSSPVQVIVRNFLKLASQSYNNLTPAQAANWAALAIDYPRNDANGSPYDVTPKGVYTSVNFYRQLAGLAQTTTAPPFVIQPAVADIIGLSLEEDPLYIFQATASVASGFYLAEASPALPGSIRKARPNEIRMLSTDVPLSFFTRSGLDLERILDPVDQKFNYSVDERFAMTVTSLSPGFLKGEFLTKEVTAFEP